MKHYTALGLIAASILLGACDGMEHDAKRAGDNIHAAYDDTRFRLANLIYSEREQTNLPPPPPTAFCYKLLMDTVCYDRPKPELHQQLVAVQGIHSYRYEDFLPNKVLEQEYGTTNVYGAQAYPAVPVSSGTIVTSELGAPASIQTESGLQQTPFYHSPSPAAEDPYGKPEEPVTALEYDDDRSKAVPIKLMGQ